MLRKLKLILIIFVAVMVLILAGYLYYNYQERKFEVVFFDVGQGDSALINLPGNHEILIDGGPDMSVLYKLGKYLPVYDRDIELMILTHPHADHVTGLVEVLQRYKVKKIIYTGVKYKSKIYQKFLELVNNNNAPQRVSAGVKSINLDNKNDILKIIYPWENFENKEFKDLNNSSIVVKLDTPDKDFLFTGDISVKVEKKILRFLKCAETEHCPLLNADVLKVAHQGSETSSSEAFLKAVSPKWAVIPVGANNKFGHPSLRVIKRLERIGAKVFRTDKDGDVIFKVKN